MKLIALIQVKNITGLGKTSIYQLMRDGKFPLNIKIGLCCVIRPENQTACN
ncbi:AlpA family phage regulatory protein [Vibrio parahaemolyticus]